LLGVWGGSPKVSILVAGGSESVRGMTSKARAAGYPCVCGLQDRDFGSTNRAKWSPSTDVFRLEMHEIENALLSDLDAVAEALRALGRSRSRAELLAKLSEEATKLSWGMATGAALRWLHQTVNQDFPASMLSGIRTQADAEAMIASSPWWIDTLPALSSSQLLPRARQALQDKHAECTRDLSTNRFLVTFSGKELLGPIQSWMLQGGKPDPGLDDLAKAIAAEQAAGSSVPAEIQEIEQHILGAISRSSTPGSR
jgi:hypothetical protein